MLVAATWLWIKREVRRAEAVAADASQLRQPRRGKESLLALCSGMLKEARLSPRITRCTLPRLVKKASILSQQFLFYHQIF